MWLPHIDKPLLTPRLQEDRVTSQVGVSHQQEIPKTSWVPSLSLWPNYSSLEHMLPGTGSQLRLPELPGSLPSYEGIRRPDLNGAATAKGLKSPALEQWSIPWGESCRGWTGNPQGMRSAWT